ncbi:MAG: hypothetical protein MZW92_33315 [Comamonadaceae bacterium]|nr:hypothetical protein [Comamonadaceae bacterium]
MTVVWWRPVAVRAMLLVVAGCASRPPTRPLPGADGPEEAAAAQLCVQVPDAQPKLEPIREGGPTIAAGRTVRPGLRSTRPRADAPYAEEGLAPCTAASSTAGPAPPAASRTTCTR